MTLSGWKHKRKTHNKWHVLREGNTTLCGRIIENPQFKPTILPGTSKCQTCSYIVSDVTRYKDDYEMRPGFTRNLNRLVYVA